jgi:hypothetical protein
MIKTPNILNMLVQVVDILINGDTPFAGVEFLIH